jgi:butyryl-CoA dehydrogenase
MNFKFDEDEKKMLDIIHEFGVNEVALLAAEIDEQERFPMELRNRLTELGMMGICYPKEYGGGGHSYLAYIAVIEELAKHCSTTSVMLSGHHSLGAFPIAEFGNEEQKQKYLVPLLTGEKLGAFGVTEPAAGSDAGNQQTTAIDKGDYWLLNGTKVFITNGYYADTYFITATTGMVEKKGRMAKEISAFIVEKGTPGFTFGTKENGYKRFCYL